jgi:amidophosphoribosyltransferase
VAFLGLSAPRIGAIVTRKLPRLSALAWKHYSIGLIVKVITNFNKSLLLINRGQESCGVVTSEGNNEFHIHKGMGLVKNVFNKDNISKLKGSLGIGHTRYTTRAASSSVNCQPFVVHSMHGSLATAHNGQLVNCSSLRKRVLDRGVGLSTHSDSEIITQALCLIPPEGEVNGPDWPARIRHLMQLAPLSYSVVLMLKDRIYAIRDPYGNRPLCLGKILPSHAERKCNTKPLNRC